jgi:hypothetical protein
MTKRRQVREMSKIGNRYYTLLFAAVVLMLVASACTLPGLTASAPSAPEEANPTTPPAIPTDTPAAPATVPTDTPVAVEPASTPAPPPAAGAVRQWATGATASSEYGSDSWSARQATGAPDTMDCGDIQTAWASEASDGVEWLEVTFDTAVVPTEISIRETHSPGFINRVEVKDEMGRYHTVWEGTPGAVDKCPRVLTIPVSGVDVRVNTVRINLDQTNGGDWDEIDAVELVGVPSGGPAGATAATPTQPPVAGGMRQWAVSAVAGSEYDNPEWSAQQATGAPNVGRCEDNQNAWASESADGIDWLEVTFATAVVPTEINIHENNSPGFINKVEVKDEAGLYYTVWQGTPGAVEECPLVLSIPVSGVNVRVSAVRINLDQAGGWYNEIDAVELVGQP